MRTVTKRWDDPAHPVRPTSQSLPWAIAMHGKPLFVWALLSLPSTTGQFGTIKIDWKQQGNGFATPTIDLNPTIGEEARVDKPTPTTVGELPVADATTAPPGPARSHLLIALRSGIGQRRWGQLGMALGRRSTHRCHRRK